MAKYRVQKKAGGTYSLIGTLLFDGAVVKRSVVTKVERSKLRSAAAIIAADIGTTRKALVAVRVGADVPGAVN